MALRIPNIAIVGRPNVGKSTMFNRLLGERKAIVEDMPGVTRDRNYALVERYSVPFLLVDTGGFTDEPEDEMEKEVVAQTTLAAEEADVVLCLFDGAAGYQDSDRAVVDMLRRRGKPVTYAVNKCDGLEQYGRIADFYQLGVDELHDVSALHGRKVEELIEGVLRGLPEYDALKARERDREARIRDAQEAARNIPEVDDEEYASAADTAYDEEELEEETIPNFAPVYLPDDENLSETDYDRLHGTLSLEESKSSAPRIDKDWVNEYELEAEGDPEEVSLESIQIAIVGRPNVGKSTLLNTLIGERRAITSPVAGTTRDTLDVEVKRDGQKFVIVDTAGLRKRGKIEENTVERYSALRSLGALSACDVAVVVLDATQEPTDQDEKIAGLAHEQGKGLVIAVNKWDLVEKDHTTVHQFTKKVRESFKFAPYAPLVFLSALSGRRCPKILDEALHIAKERVKRVPTNRLNQVLERAIRRKALPIYRGRPVKLYYAVQVDAAPPRFAMFFNYPKEVHFSYMRYLKNALREEFQFEGTDMKLIPRKR